MKKSTRGGNAQSSWVPISWNPSLGTPGAQSLLPNKLWQKGQAGMDQSKIQRKAVYQERRVKFSKLDSAFRVGRSRRAKFLEAIFAARIQRGKLVLLGRSGRVEDPWVDGSLQPSALTIFIGTDFTKSRANLWKICWPIGSRFKKFGYTLTSAHRAHKYSRFYSKRTEQQDQKQYRQLSFVRCRPRKYFQPNRDRFLEAIYYQRTLLEVVLASKSRSFGRGTYCRCRKL